MGGDTAGVASPTNWRQTDLAKRLLKPVEASAQAAAEESDAVIKSKRRSWQPHWQRTELGAHGAVAQRLRTVGHTRAPRRCLSTALTQPRLPRRCLAEWHLALRTAPPPFFFGLGVRQSGGVRLMPLARAAADVGAS